MGDLNRTFKYDANGNTILGDTDVDPAAYGFDAENRLTELVTAPPKAGTGTGFDCVDQNNSAGGHIDLIDLSQIAQGFGQGPGSPKFARRDVTGDKVISVLDLSREAAWDGLDCSTRIDSYAYDGTGTLTKRKLEQNGTTSWTAYVDNVFEKTNTGAVRKYYAALGRTLAMHDGGTLTYILQDHLGSTVERLDTAGATVPNSEIKYWPYGATRGGGAGTVTDLRYTGQRQEPGDAAMGLYNYKARFYSTAMGRFLSADPAEGPNRYSYVYGAPIRYSDPSGLTPACAGCLSYGYEEAGRDKCISGPSECSLGPAPHFVPSLHWIARYADVVRAQAAFWGIDPAYILAIITVESDKGFLERQHENLGSAAAFNGGDLGFWAYVFAVHDEPDYGLGNVTVTALLQLEVAGFPKLGDDVYSRITALQDAETSIMVVAALLAYYQRAFVSHLHDPQTRMEHAMLIYAAGSDVYENEWQAGGYWRGPIRGAGGLYERNPISGYGGDAAASINRFLLIVDEARTTLRFCETADAC